MITVNLLRNTSVGSAAGILVEGASPDAKKAAVLRLLAISAFPILVYGYEYFSLHDASAELKEWQAKVQALQAEKAKFGDAGPRIDRAIKQKAEVDKKLETIRLLARSRLKEVKTLDALQTLTPQKSWIKKLTIEGSKVNLEAFASTPEAFTEFLKAIESSAYFSKVEPKKTEETTAGANKVKKFDLEFQIGSGDTGVKGG